eukprot:4769723-Pleurochrysis_carterae.AAC.1
MLRRSTTPASLAFAHALAWLPLCSAPAPHSSSSAYIEARAIARATFSVFAASLAPRPAPQPCSRPS